MKKKPQRPWTEREHAILDKCYPVGGSPMVMAALAEAGLASRSKSSISGMAYNRGLKSGLFGKPNAGCFQKGQAPPNKGKKMSEELRAKVARTWFKKGNLPHNTIAYDFAVSFRPKCTKRGECPWFVKWSLGKWVPINQWVWAEVHGHQPPKFLVSITGHGAFYALCEAYFPKKTPKKEPDGHWQNLLRFTKEAILLLELIPMSKNAQRNWDWETGTRAARELSFDYVAGVMTHKQPKIREILKKEYPTLIQAQRQAMLNRRAAKKITK